jgi:hypothetical protein
MRVLDRNRGESCVCSLCLTKQEIEVGTLRSLIHATSPNMEFSCERALSATTSREMLRLI